MLLRAVRTLLLENAEIAAGASVSVGNAEDGDRFPRIVLDALSGAPNLNGLQDGTGARIWAAPRLQVAVISADASLDSIDAIAAVAFTILDGLGSFVVEGEGEIVTMEQDFAYIENPVEENNYRATIVAQYSTTARAS